MGLSNFYFLICTNPRVLQRFVHRDAAGRAVLSRGRYVLAGAVETQAPHSGARRGQRGSQARPKPRRATSLFTAWVVAGVEPPRTLASKVRPWPRFMRRTGCRFRRRAAASLQIHLFVGIGRKSFGCNPWLLGPSTHTTALCPSWRPHLGLFARGSKKASCAFCLGLSA